MGKQNKPKKFISKLVKKSSTLTIFFLASFFIIGILSGVLTYTVICRNDTFEVVGEKNIIYNVGEVVNFIDEKVKIISFGNDISSSVEIETNIEVVGVEYIIDTSEEMEYYIKYSVKDIKYGSIILYRTISVVESA